MSRPTINVCDAQRNPDVASLSPETNNMPGGISGMFFRRATILGASCREPFLSVNTTGENSGLVISKSFKLVLLITKFSGSILRILPIANVSPKARLVVLYCIDFHIEATSFTSA